MNKEEWLRPNLYDYPICRNQGYSWVWSKPFFLVHMQKAGIIIRVWAQPFFLVHMQKSGIIIQVWAQSFFHVHMQKLGIIIISAYAQGRMAEPKHV
jgi:hypothetical protein